MKFYTLMMLLGLPFSLMADELPSVCPEPQEPMAQAVKDLIKEAPTKFKSLDEFLSNLPDEMKSNFIFMGQSRSFQTATPENPRVILTSPNSDVRMSFITDPKGRGYNNVEISIWDPNTKSFNYQELTFDPTATNGPKHHGDVACMTCHGDPVKPNWDTNNSWAGAIPFNKDTLVGNTKELEMYVSLLKKTQDKKPGNRLQYLKPLNSAEAISEGLKKKNYYTLKYIEPQGVVAKEGDGLGSSMFKKLQNKQRCAEAERLSKDKNFKNYKYLLAGMANKCDLSKFVPQWFHKVAADNIYANNFSAQRIKVVDSKTLESSLKFLEEDTQKRQEGQTKDKYTRQLQFITSVAKDKFDASEELNANLNAIGSNTAGITPGKKNESIKESTKEVAVMRYYLEPLGVLASRFSTNIDPTSFSFGEEFKNKYILDSDMKIIEEEMAFLPKMAECDKLAQLSQTTLSQPAVANKIMSETETLCFAKDTEAISIASFKDLSEVATFSKVQDILTKKCSSCHSDKSYNLHDYSIGGAPVLPFKDLATLQARMRSTDIQNSGLTEKIFDRISRAHNVPGSMPMALVSTISPEEKSQLKAWLIKFMNPEQKKK